MRSIVTTLDELEKLKAAATIGPWELSISGAIRNAKGDHINNCSDRDYIIALHKVTPALIEVARAAEDLVNVNTEKLTPIEWYKKLSTLSETLVLLEKLEVR